MAANAAIQRSSSCLNGSAIVSALHLLFGVWLSNAVDYADLAANIGLSTLGNLVGGLLLVTLTHTARSRARDAVRPAVRAV